jgi:hypothetical protein
MSMLISVFLGLLTSRAFIRLLFVFFAFLSVLCVVNQDWSLGLGPSLRLSQLTGLKFELTM